MVRTCTMLALFATRITNGHAADVPSSKLQSTRVHRLGLSCELQAAVETQRIDTNFLRPVDQLVDGLWSAWSYVSSSIWASADDDSTAADPSATRAAAALVEQLDRRLAAKEFDRAATLLDPSVDWTTPSWRAHGVEPLKRTWRSGVDDKWGVSPVWRGLRATADRSVFTRECDTFRVLGWPIRLRQTFHVRKTIFITVVRKAVIERL